MKKVMKAVGISAALAVMIPLSAYAATNTSTDAPSSNGAGKAKTSATKIVKDDVLKNKEDVVREVKIGPGPGFLSQEVLDLLKLDKKTLLDKLSEDKTLAKIAEEQGVSREALKKAMTDSFNKQMEEQKKQFSDNLDKMVDGELKQGPVFKKFVGGPGIEFHEEIMGEAGHSISKGAIMIGHAGHFDLIAKELGITAQDLKKALESGKSIADLAKEKGVDVQKLIDAHKKAVTDSINQQVKDGELTQEMANKLIERASEMAEHFINGKPFHEKIRIFKGPKGDIQESPDEELQL